MVVAIPAVSRTIENARKDTFIDTRKKYVDSAQTMWLADDLSCNVNGQQYNASAVPEGNYYIAIDTSSANGSFLLEKGGKSSWGDRDIKGYIKVEYANVKPDDVNLDGIVDSEDADYLKQYLNGWVSLNSKQQAAADINSDGKINARDVAFLEQTFAGWHSPPPVVVTSYYPVITDGEHGVNVDTTLKESKNLVRGDLVTSGATYDKAQLSGTEYMCVER